MKHRRTSNPKRRLRPAGAPIDPALAVTAAYGGNPEHKRNPGDFGLDPPCFPRQGKSLCDDAAVFTRTEALTLLREGFRKGMVSVQERTGWPQNVWAVTQAGVPLEAMLENSILGVYHGYPMLPDDPLAAEVLEQWSLR